MDIYEAVPHVIPIEIQLNLLQGISHYQVSIPPMECNFKLKRIVTNYPLVMSIRLIRTITTPPIIYYEAPGWLHYDRFDYQLEPPIMFLTKQPSWMLDVGVSAIPEPFENKIQLALLGEKLMPIL